MDGSMPMPKRSGELPVWVMHGPFFYFNHHESDPKLPVDGIAHCRIASHAAALDIPFASKVFGAQELIEYYWDQSVPESWSSLFVVPRERLQALGRFDVTTLDVL